MDANLVRGSQTHHHVTSLISWTFARAVLNSLRRLSSICDISLVGFTCKLGPHIVGLIPSVLRHVLTGWQVIEVIPKTGSGFNVFSFATFAFDLLKKNYNVSIHLYHFRNASGIAFELFQHVPDC